jgi:hypothetical protein
LIPINDKEAFESAVQTRFGGGRWRLILKCGKQRRTEANIYTGDGPTLPPPDVGTELMPPIPGASPNNPFTQNLQKPAMSGEATIAAKAIDTIAGQEHQAVNLGLGMMTTAADVMKRFAERSTEPPPQTVTGPAAELQNALTNALINRLSQDPLQQVSQMFSLMRELNGNVNTGNEIGRQMDGMRSVFSFARELMGGNNHAPGAVASTGAEIVRVVAGAIPQAVDGIREWRIGKEAEERTAALMMQPPQPRPQQSPFNPQRPAALPVPVPQPVPVMASPMPPPNGGAPTTEYIEMRILDLFNAPISADEAASRTLEFLHTLSGDHPTPDRAYVLQLAALKEQGLINLFNMRPTLQPATKDMARLQAFIQAFLNYHAKDLEDEGISKKPN